MVYIYLKVVDKADNVTEVYKSLKIDNKPPTIEVTTSVYYKKTKTDDYGIYEGYPLINKDKGIKYIVVMEDKNFDADNSYAEAVVPNELVGKCRIDTERSASNGEYEYKITISWDNDANVNVSGYDNGLENIDLSIKAVDLATNEQEEFKYTSKYNSFVFDTQGAKVNEESREGRTQITIDEEMEKNLSNLFKSIFFNSNNTNTLSKVTSMSREVVDIEIVEDSVVVDVVEDEDIVSVEYSVNDSEYNILEREIELDSNIEVYYITIKANYVDEELKKLFVLSKKNNKWTISK